jgi:hypothetical protein
LDAINAGQFANAASWSFRIVQKDFASEKSAPSLGHCGAKVTTNLNTQHALGAPLWEGNFMRPSVSVPVAASFAALLSFPALLSAADGTRVTSPLVHENLAIYFVHGTAAGGAVPLTLQDGLATGQVKVREIGSVNQLTIENIGNDEVFVQAGDIVKGGRQDRVLSVDLLLPPHSGAVPIAAFCVEHGRWTARGNEDVTQFESAASAMPSHDAMLAMRAYSAADAAPTAPDSPTRRADPGLSQQEIWATVQETQQRLARSVGGSVASPSSLQLSLESEKLKQAQAVYISALQGAGESSDDIVGYVLAINGKISGGDVYPSNALFRKMWAKMLAANVTDAIAKKDAAGGAPPSIKDVEGFLAAAETAPKSERMLNASVRLATRDGNSSLSAETQRADGSWVHRAYLAK